MEKDISISEEIIKDKRFIEEKEKLIDLFKDLSKEKKPILAGLIDSAAFLRVVLERCQDDVEKNGYKETYQNGANQHGFKRSISADLYATYIKQYQSVMRLLIDMCPGLKNSSLLDKYIKSDFDKFIES